MSDAGFTNVVPSTFEHVGSADVLNPLPINISGSRPNREAVQQLFARDKTFESVVLASRSSVIERPNRVEKAVLEHYQRHLEVEPGLKQKFATGIDLVRDASLLQRPDSLTTVKTLEVPHHVKEAMSQVFDDLTSTVAGQNQLLSGVFKPPHSDESH